MPLVPMPNETYFVLLSAPERQVLAKVCAELRAELTDGADDPSFRRLFPTAYADDPDRQQFFDQMTRGELTDTRIAALTTVIDTADNESLTGDEIESWMLATNAIRLVLGTRLDLSEDDDLDRIEPDDPNLRAYLLYGFLSDLLGSIVICLRNPGPSRPR